MTNKVNSKPERAKPQPLSERTIDDLWRERQEEDGLAKHHTERRREREEELGRRCAELGARRLALSNGSFVKYVEPTTWVYDARGLKELGEYLIAHGYIQPEAWNEHIQWIPKVNGTWMKQFSDYGDEVRELIDKARMGKTSSLHWEGPSLAVLRDMGKEEEKASQQ